MLQAAVALLVGGLIYVSSRHEGLWMFSWFREAGLQPLVDALRGQAGGGARLAEWIRFSLPDGLWVYSGTCVMLAVWSARVHRASIGWVAAPLVLGLGAELAQAVGLLPGTFDVVDSLFIVLGAAVALRQVEAGVEQSVPSALDGSVEGGLNT